MLRAQRILDPLATGQDNPNPSLMNIHYWLVKQEPADYSWDTFVNEGPTPWTGVRNPQARLHLRAMQPRDPVLFYHSGPSKCIVGLAQVRRAAYPDPTDADHKGWVAVDLVPVKPLPRPIPLAVIKQDPAFQTLALVRQSRLSVMPVTPAQWQRLTELAGL